MTVIATYEFDSAEHYRALWAMFRFNRARWLIPVLGIGMPAVAIWAFVVRDWDRLSPFGALLNGLPWVFIGAFYLALVPLMYRSLARRAVRDDPRVRGTQVRTLSEAGFEARGAGFSQRLAWPELVRVEEVKDFFLFFYNRRAAYYIPKRCLQTADEAGLRTLIADYRTTTHLVAEQPGR